MISAPLDVVVEKMEAKAPGSTAGADLIAHHVGDATVAFVVHGDNPVSFLTLDQIAGIVSGNVSNWSEVGGPDMPNATMVPTVASQMPPVFGLAGHAAASAAGARILTTDAPISQPLILVTKGQPSADMQRVIDAVKSAGAS